MEAAELRREIAAYCTDLNLKLVSISNNGVRIKDPQFKEHHAMVNTMQQLRKKFEKMDYNWCVRCVYNEPNPLIRSDPPKFTILARIDKSRALSINPARLPDVEELTELKSMLIKLNDISSETKRRAIRPLDADFTSLKDILFNFVKEVGMKGVRITEGPNHGRGEPKRFDVSYKGKSIGFQVSGGKVAVSYGTSSDYCIDRLSVDTLYISDPGFIIIVKKYVAWFKGIHDADDIKDYVYNLNV